jgi:hypothetical protein
MQMAKVDIDLVRKILHQNEIDGETISQILDDLESELGAGEEDTMPPPPVKKQFVILVSDPDGKFAEDMFMGWVLQIPEEKSAQEVNADLIRAAYEFNASKRGSKDPAKTITDVCEIVPSKILRKHSVWVKTKEPILVIHTNNKVPTIAALGKAGTTAAILGS